MTRTKWLKATVAGAMLCAAVIGCTSEEGQQKAWVKNKDAVEMYQAKFPSFKVVLQKRLDEATRMFEDAKKKGDEKARIKAMKLANERLYDLTRHFKSYQASLSKIQRLKTDRDVKQGDYDEVRIMMQLADQSMEKAERMLKVARVKTAGETQEVLRKATLVLADAERMLKKRKDTAVRARSARRRATNARTQKIPTHGTSRGGRPASTRPSSTGTR